MISVRVKYYNNDGHFSIEGSGKFKVEGDVASTTAGVRKLQCSLLPHSEDRYCNQCSSKHLPDGSTMHVRSPFIHHLGELGVMYTFHL